MPPRLPICFKFSVDFRNSTTPYRHPLRLIACASPIEPLPHRLSGVMIRAISESRRETGTIGRGRKEEGRKTCALTQWGRRKCRCRFADISALTRAYFFNILHASFVTIVATACGLSLVYRTSQTVCGGRSSGFLQAGCTKNSDGNTGGSGI